MWNLRLVYGASLDRISFFSQTGNEAFRPLLHMMFPIYGMAALLPALYHFIKDKCIWVRGTIYALSMFAVEFFTGSFLKKHGVCPWNYSHCRFNYKGVIRLDFFPLWFLSGLFFEKVTNK